MTGPAVKYTMSAKQRQSFDRASSPQVAVTIFEGSVRAGKTFSWLLLIIGQIMNAGSRGAIVIVGKNRDSIYRNVFEPIETEDVFAMFRPFIHYRQGAPTAKIFGKTVHVIGANDAGSESRIRGMTVQLAFCDEVTILHVSFFKQLLIRMSVEGAKLFGTTNPDSPAHWLRAEYLSKVPDCRHFDSRTPDEDQLHDWYIEHFVMDDNPSLTEDYKARMRREYTGLWYRRFILGEWVSAEGAIYDMWDTTKHVVSRDELPAMSRILGMGMDYGSTNPTAGVLLGLGEDRRLYVLDEWAPRKGSTDSELADQLQSWLGTQPDPEWLFLDPSAKSFHLELYQRGHHNLARATNDVIDGIRTVASLMASDRLRVVDTCTNLIGEIPGYRWDDKASEKGEDKPVKTADHFCFVAGTLVDTEHGPQPIETIQPGDMVWTRKGLQPVAGTSETGPALTLLLETSGGTILKGTANHPVMAGAQWTEIGDLEAGDMLITRDGHDIVHDVSEGPTAPVYNLTVAGTPEYFANGVLVHNCDALRYIAHSSQRYWQYPLQEAP